MALPPPEGTRESKGADDVKSRFPDDIQTAKNKVQSGES